MKKKGHSFTDSADFLPSSYNCDYSLCGCTKDCCKLPAHDCSRAYANLYFGCSSYLYTLFDCVWVGL